MPSKINTNTTMHHALCTQEMDDYHRQDGAKGGDHHARLLLFALLTGLHQLPCACVFGVGCICVHSGYNFTCHVTNRCSKLTSIAIPGAVTIIGKSAFKELFFSAVLYHPDCTEKDIKQKCKKAGVKKLPQLLLDLREEALNAAQELLQHHPEYMQHPTPYRRCLEIRDKIQAHT